MLNSLAGDFIGKSFAVLAANGRFLEIGMTEIWDRGRVSQLNRNISYYPINPCGNFPRGSSAHSRSYDRAGERSLRMASYDPCL